MRSRLLLLLALALVPAHLAAAREPPWIGGMVVAANPLAAAAGVEILVAGGNALDAAVAVQLALGVVEPQATGVGGGGFLLAYDAATGALTSWDGRETAPAAARADLFLDGAGNPLPFRDAVLSGRSVGVPGVPAMLEAAHKAGGRLAWSALAVPAIRLAADGFPIPPRLARAIAKDAERLKRQDAARAFFLGSDGAPLPAGATLANPAQAEVLRAVAAQGADALRRGAIAADIATTVRGDPNPGLMTTDDLAAYRAKQRPPVCAEYRGHRLCGMGPPAGGVAVLQMMGILSHFDLADMAPDGVDAAQAMIEAGRLAFADRDRYLADPDFTPVPVAGLIAPGYLAVRAQAIDLMHAMPAPRAGNPSWDGTPALLAPEPAQPEHGTSDVCIVDGAGDAVAMTTTIEETFGARLMVHGFMLNNELTDFSFRPEIDGEPVANRVAPGKRPRSAIAPTLVFDAEGKTLQACVGSAGGPRIIAYVTQALAGLLEWRLSPSQALALPHALGVGKEALLEAGTPAAALGPALTARGQMVREVPLESGSTAILLTPAGPVGAADPRRDGIAARVP